MTPSIMKTAILTGSLLLALAGRAAAQPGVADPVLDTPPPPPSAAQAPQGAEGAQLSESTALSLSLGGTLGSWGLLIGAPFVSYFGHEDAGTVMSTAGGLGVLFAPSFGRWYAGEIFTRGLGLRLGGAALTIVGVGMTLAEAPIGFGHDDTPEDDSKTGGLGPVVLMAGLGMFAWGTVEDIAKAPGAARRTNRERAGAGFALAPLVTRHSAGFALGGQF